MACAHSSIGILCAALPLLLAFAISNRHPTLANSANTPALGVFTRFLSCFHPLTPATLSEDEVSNTARKEPIFRIAPTYEQEQPPNQRDIRRSGWEFVSLASSRSLASYINRCPDLFSLVHATPGVLPSYPSAMLAGA